MLKTLGILLAIMAGFCVYTLSLIAFMGAPVAEASRSVGGWVGVVGGCGLYVTQFMGHAPYQSSPIFRRGIVGRHMDGRIVCFNDGADNGRTAFICRIASR